ncbi:TonB family protein [Myxococcus sp. Y35]|uniref:TonB family protein n=1 Tax=Pseudomyxococcus flavus TaxID=3115648 RepID=UPI003CEBA232
MPDAGAKDRAPEAALFASVLRPHAALAGRRKRLLGLVLVALGLHAAALLGVASRWHGAPRRLEGSATHGEVLVLRLTAPPAPPRAGAPAASPSPTPPRPRAARRPRPFRPPVPATRPHDTMRVPREAEPHDTTAASRKAEPHDTATASREDKPHDTATASREAEPHDAATALREGEPLSAGAPASGAPSGPGSLAGRAVAGVMQRSLGPGAAGLLLEAPPPPPPDTRAADERRYFEQMFRDRFEDLPYPQEARMAGIEGQLMLRITVGVQGQLVALSVRGPCPHPILCEAAQDAVRQAAPFPPPPPSLGGNITVELPFNYHLE